MKNAKFNLVASGDTNPIFPPTGDFDLNQGIYTTMSYNDGLTASGGNPGTLDYGYQGTPMAFDIAAIQHLYGANMSHNTGNDTYFLPTVNASGTFYSAIWDAGGIDTISGAGASAGVEINLNDATLNITDGAGAGGYRSAAMGIFGGFTIANGVVIENADGSDFDDSIIGNEFNNSIFGDDGNDNLIGGWGHDFLYGGSSNDSLYGGGDNDYHNGGDGDDLIAGWNGNDTLIGGAGNDSLYGDGGNDILTGSNPSVYNSGTGEYDDLIGGLGADTFVLGDAYEAYYRGSGYATITDFNWAEGDKFRVFGSTSDYSLREDTFNGGIDILYQGDLIAWVSNTTDVVMAEDFDFV